MKHSATLLFITFGLLLPAASQAQIGIKFRGNGNWCIGDPYHQYFTNSTLETVNGQVMSIDTVTPMPRMSSGIKIVLKTSRENVTVHLGPAWFVLYQDMTLLVNDKNVEVSGCRTVINEKPVIMATTLVRKNMVLLLRDKDGIPYWCGWRSQWEWHSDYPSDISR